MGYYTEIPSWTVGHLAHYSPLQQAVALRWAMENLDAGALHTYYQFAKYYRPAMRRDLQAMVDQIGMILEEASMRYGNMQNGQLMNAQAVAMPQAPLMQQAASLGITPGDISAWVNMGAGAVNAAAGAATNIFGAISAGRCAFDPMADGCPAAPVGGTAGGADPWAVPPAAAQPPPAAGPTQYQGYPPQGAYPTTAYPPQNQYPGYPTGTYPYGTPATPATQVNTAAAATAAAQQQLLLQQQLAASSKKDDNTLLYVALAAVGLGLVVSMKK